jgi:predicted Fe-S protein YdhL (DUF1289 family)
MPRKKRADARATCKICGRGVGEVKFYPSPSRQGLPEYCVGCNSKSVTRKRWLAMHRKGKLQELIRATEDRLAEMMSVRDMHDAGKHPINW